MDALFMGQAWHHHRGKRAGKLTCSNQAILVISVAAAQADVFQKNSDNKLNKIDTNMKIKR